LATGKKWAVIIGVIALLGLIGNAMYEKGGRAEPAPVPGPGSGPGSGDNASWAAGFWTDQFGNRFNVTQNAAGFVATGTISGVATELRGQISTTRADFTMAFASGLKLRGEGSVSVDANNSPHMNFTLEDGTKGLFHINHVK